MATTTTRTMATRLLGAAFVAALALAAAAGAALTDGEATGVTSPPAGTTLAKVGGVQTRMSMT
jgi:hypothetical protein